MSFEDVHSIDVVADVAEAGEALGVLLVSGVVEAGDAGAFEEGVIAGVFEDFGYADPVGLLFEFAGCDDEGHAVEALL